MSAPKIEFVWKPENRMQHATVHAPFAEMLLGGARGGGKTDAIIGRMGIRAEKYGKDYNGILFRRTLPSADDLLERAKAIYCAVGAEYKVMNREFRFPGGARIRLRPLYDESDAAAFQGQSLTEVAIEEAGLYPNSTAIDMIFACLRSSAGVPTSLVLSANPGGAGQGWLKSRFIDPAPKGWEPLRRMMPNGKLSHEFIFLPSRLHENVKLMEADPGYADRLQLSGNKELIRQWLEGDWNTIAGSYFAEFGDQHIVKPCPLPAHWSRIRAFDWGYAKPFATLWGAVSDGELPQFQRGSIVIYREYYGCVPGQPNTGVRMTSEEVAFGILQREKAAKETPLGVADPSIFACSDGPSIAERMANQGCYWNRADNKRVGEYGALGGWDIVRSRLKGDEDGPMIYIFDTCKDLIRTIPLITHDRHRAEDVDCWAAGTMVSTPSGDVPIEDVAVGNIVDTPVGPRPVLRSYLSGASETVEVALVNGRTLRGTPNHKVFVRNRGLVELQHLRTGDELQEKIRWSRSLSTTVSCIDAIQAATTISQAVVRKLCTVALCSMQALISLPAMMCITRMETTTTTNYPISNACLKMSTIGYTFASDPTRCKNGSERGQAPPRGAVSSYKPHGRCARTRLNGNSRAVIAGLLSARDILRRSIARLSARVSLCLLKPAARFAVTRSEQSAIRPSKSAPARIVAVGRCAERTQVYNLTVSHAHLFYANGFLSSNTDCEDHAVDCLRYLVASRPYIASPPREERQPNSSTTYGSTWRRRSGAGGTGWAA